MKARAIKYIGLGTILLEAHIPIGIASIIPKKLAAIAIWTLSSIPRINNSHRLKSGGSIRATIFTARGRPNRNLLQSIFMLNIDQRRYSNTNNARLCRMRGFSTIRIRCHCCAGLIPFSTAIFILQRLLSQFCFCVSMPLGSFSIHRLHLPFGSLYSNPPLHKYRSGPGRLFLLMCRQRQFYHQPDR